MRQGTIGRQSHGESSLEHDKGDRAEDGDQGVARIPQGAEKALQDPCEPREARRLSGGHLEFVEKWQLSLQPCNIVIYS